MNRNEEALVAIESLKFRRTLSNGVAGSNSANSHQHTIQRLAALSPLEYDQVRVGEAKALNVRPGTLDKEVAKARCEITDSSADEVVRK